MGVQMYLEAVLDGFNAVRARPHVSRMPMFRLCAEALVPFLAVHFREACIASPDMREMLLQTISILLQSKTFVTRFEASVEARTHLVCPAPRQPLVITVRSVCQCSRAGLSAGVLWACALEI